MSKWIGYAVSVNCGEPLGYYQGIILEADGSTITLTKAFRNGFPYNKSQVTLKAEDIKELKIIDVHADTGGQSQSLVPVSRSGRKGARNTVCESLQANSSNTGIQHSTGPETGASSPRAGRTGPDIQGRHVTANESRGTGTVSSGAGAKGGLRKRNDLCLASVDAGDPALALDFDFETNLALFDKRALWEQMRLSHRPDLLRQTEECGGGKFRHDENVLGPPAVTRRTILVPEHLRGPSDYVTDEGAPVPSASPELRRLLWVGLERVGLLEGTVLLLARAAADLALRMVGGGRRLEARNAHQAPTVVLLAGPTREGACGVTCCRLLSAHGVRTGVLVAGAGHACGERARALREYGLGEHEVYGEVGELPRPDLVLVALAPHSSLPGYDHEAESAWARAARCGVLALEPPALGTPGVEARACLCAVLPLAHSPANGRVHLANVAPPRRLLRELGLQYPDPFAAATLLALHPAD